MCGIAGVSLKRGQNVKDTFLRSLSESLSHRGPDGEGFLKRNGLGLVHRRLSIIDVEGGAQPISDSAEKIHIICNGEIYNYKQLRHAASKSVFKTGSDTEAALHSYIEHGADFVNHILGMYALAIYDDDTENLLLARDPFGIKPLYICETEKGVAFASEPAALVKSGWIQAEVEKSVLLTYLNRQYTAGLNTLFKGIKRVMPGEVIIISQGEVIKREVFPLQMLNPENPKNGSYIDTFDLIFDNVVSDHLQSDVPYGVFLSGGIDSSSVVIKMSELEKNVRTFTIGFESETVSDERLHAEDLTAKHTND